MALEENPSQSERDFSGTRQKKTDGEIQHALRNHILQRKESLYLAPHHNKPKGLETISITIWMWAITFMRCCGVPLKGKEKLTGSQELNIWTHHRKERSPFAINTDNCPQPRAPHE